MNARPSKCSIIHNEDKKLITHQAASRNMAAASSTPFLPPTLYTDFGISQAKFQATFNVVSDGTFRLKPDCSLQFTHAVLTTGDRASTIVRQPTDHEKPLYTGSAGELWTNCTGKSIRDETCCVFNCPNPECKAPEGKPQKAGATAHVYATFQTPQHEIRYMILLPTCSYDNNAGQTRRSGTNFPQTGEKANILHTVTGARMIFIEVNPKTEAKKGKGKGTSTAPPGQGGEYKGLYKKAEAKKGPAKGVKQTILKKKPS